MLVKKKNLFYSKCNSVSHGTKTNKQERFKFQGLLRPKKQTKHLLTMKQETAQLNKAGTMAELPV